MADALDSQATAFAHLLGMSGNDADTAFRRAFALADGLFPHQVEGVAFLLGRPRAILADDMGLGKTRQAIVSPRHLAPAGPYFVVCPASVKRNWAREIGLVASDATILVIEGSAAVAPTAEWVIVNYDILGRHWDALEQVAWAALVFDEAHYLKNHTSARSRLARDLTARASANAAQPLAVQLLTGTPLTSRPAISSCCCSSPDTRSGAASSRTRGATAVDDHHALLVRFALIAERGQVDRGQLLEDVFRVHSSIRDPGRLRECCERHLVGVQAGPPLEGHLRVLHPHVPASFAADRLEAQDLDTGRVHLQ